MPGVARRAGARLRRPRRSPGNYAPGTGADSFTYRQAISNHAIAGAGTHYSCTNCASTKTNTDTHTHNTTLT